MELNSDAMSTMLNTKQSATKQTRLDRQENPTEKNCGKTHFSAPLTKFPNILLGKAKMLINKSGFVSRFLTFKYFSIIKIFKLDDITIELPRPTMRALTPMYLGKNMIESIIKTLPIT